MLKFKHNYINNIDLSIKYELFLNEFLIKELKSFFNEYEISNIKLYYIDILAVFDWFYDIRIDFKLKKYERPLKLSLKFNKHLTKIKYINELLSDIKMYNDGINKSEMKINLHIEINNQKFLEIYKKLTKEKLIQLIDGKTTT